MKQEYNWKAILIGAIPVSAVMAVIHYLGRAGRVINWYLLAGILIAMGITYCFDRKKQNIFTSAFIVIIAVLAVSGLKSLGFL